MDVRLMAFDLDGTLLGSDKHVPEKNRRALRKAAEKGIHLMLCSGRAFEVQLEYADEIGVDFLFSSANGARIDGTAAFCGKRPWRRKPPGRFFRCFGIGACTSWPTPGAGATCTTLTSRSG